MNPRLRSVVKVPAPYPLNEFTNQILISIAQQLVAARFARRLTDFIGEEWERAFAHAIGAEWHPSNVGLDDVQLQNCCWGAKTVKATKPFTQPSVRLISGRNSPAFSFGDANVKEISPAELGEKILSIWNERVGSVRAKFNHVRTVVLLKGPDLLSAAVFETDTILYQADAYNWLWNKNGNLVGTDEHGANHFTWQPHGSQFTIHEKVPAKRHKIAISPPENLRDVSTQELLELISFDSSWIKIS